MSGVALAVSAVAAVAGTTMSTIQGNKAASAEKNAAQQAQANAQKTAAQADQAFNAQNQKHPDVAGILSAAQQAGKGGASGTMLTGPGGVDPSTLQLGKSTLLGS